MDLNATEQLIARLEKELVELDNKKYIVQDTPTDRNPSGDYPDASDGGPLFGSCDEVELHPETLGQRIDCLRRYVDSLDAAIESRKREKEEVAGLLGTLKKEREHFLSNKRARDDSATNGTTAAAAADPDPKKAKPAAPSLAPVVSVVPASVKK